MESSVIHCWRQMGYKKSIEPTEFPIYRKILVLFPSTYRNATGNLTYFGNNTVTMEPTCVLHWNQSTRLHSPSTIQHTVHLANPNK